MISPAPRLVELAWCGGLLRLAATELGWSRWYLEGDDLEAGRRCGMNACSLLSSVARRVAT